MLSMIGGVRLQAGGQVELVGRQLQHIDRPAVHVLEAEHADADVAADAGVAAGAGADVADQGRGRRLAVGAGDGDDLRALVGRGGVDRAGEELDVAEDLDAGRLGALTVQCGAGWVRGTPGDSIRAAN
jgi:hypothetical protein